EAPAPASAAPAASGAAPSFGLTRGGGGGGGGVAVATAPAAQPTAASEAVKTAAPKSLTRPKSAQPTCDQPLVKPKPIDMPQPAYPSQAREAGIAGKVRVELKVDASGRVVSARVLEGLGHGLDEAALEAARTARFEPATLCGAPTETSFVIGMRFNL
ncbi:MAG: energy transducer TonB, partial [Polyangiales bacterium]